jgi:predicted MFS family arabinose efflux permease
MPPRGSPGAGVVRRTARRIRTVAVEAAGGPARVRVALTLAAVLAVSGADTGTIASVADNLERYFGVGNTQIGLLLTVVSLTGAVCTVPAGILTDRVHRTRLLGGSIVIWAVATVASGAATSYLWLLLARVALGVVTATAGPAIASLTGDFFPAADRARMYGLILGGELAGSGMGFLISGDLSSVTTWRAAFWWLAVPSLALAWVVWRLPEPARDGTSRIPAGATEVSDERDVAAARHAPRVHARRRGKSPRQEEPAPVERALADSGIGPRQDLVLREDPGRRSLWWAVGYILRVRTNVVIIVASALGYFYFAGLRSFAVIFATRHYGISKPTASLLILVIGLGTLAGVYLGGRATDRLLRRGHLRVRVFLPAVCLLAVTPVFAAGIAARAVPIALPLLIAGGFLLGAPNPGMDAARLDIMPGRLWGRAEAVRTALRSAGEATAPLLFGFVSQYVFGGPGAASPGPASQGTSSPAAASGGTSAAQSAGLEYTFLFFLAALLIAGLFALAALRTYPRDVATAVASDRAIGQAAAGSRDAAGSPAA